MSTLNVTIVQADLHWHDAEANRRLFDTALSNLAATDLVVLPEMFTTGFTMHASSQAESMEGPSMAWLAQTADRLQSAVCGSLIIEDRGQYFNRFVLMQPGGRYDVYDKRHLFRLANEDEHYSAGTEHVIIDVGGFRVCPMVCYDLRFPVWSRNVHNYDLLLYVANWPAPRHLAWQTLIRARAIENQAYVAAVNRSGTDGNDLPYLGGSAIVNYLGETLLDLGEQSGSGSVVIDRAELDAHRQRFAFQKDADRFTLER